MEVYLIEQDNMTKIDKVDVDLEENLEDRLVRTESAEIGGVEILYIGQQGTTEGGKVYDLMGIDEDGNVVVVELKRGKAPRRVIAQALDYVSRIKYQNYDNLEEDYEDFRRRYNYDESKSLRELHKSHFELDEALSQDEFNTEQRMVIVGTSFDDATTNMADYLREEGELDVMLAQYERYEDPDRDVELLTTNAVRRPLSEEPAVQSDKSLTDKQKRRKEFWKEFQSKHQEHGLRGSGSTRKSASYSIYVFTSGKRNRPAYIRPKVSYGAAYNAVRFYGDSRSVVTESELREEFERAVSEAASNLDVDLPSDMSEAYTFEWEPDETREFDLLTIHMENSNHNEFRDDQKVSEILEWLVDTSIVLKKALNEFKKKEYI